MQCKPIYSIHYVVRRSSILNANVNPKTTCVSDYLEIQIKNASDLYTANDAILLPQFEENRVADLYLEALDEAFFAHLVYYLTL